MKDKKPCELCNSLATLYCESDQANLCWDCDSRVHGANFLVAKHSRNLLCRSCQSPTPWNASGPRLAPIFSVCEECVNHRACDDRGSSTRSSHENGGGDDRDCDGDSDGRAADDNGDGDEENQVVPGGSSLVAAPPVVTSPSSSEESRVSDSSATAISGKRVREEEPELCSVWGPTSDWKKYRVLIE